MAIAGEVVDSIAERVRDPSNTSHSRADIRDVLNRVQTALNADQGYVLENLLFATIPGQAIYRLETHTPNMVSINDIDVDGRFLDEIPWRNLWKASSGWLTDVGDPIAWSMIGRSLFVIYPVPTEPRVICITGPKITTLLTDDNIPLDLRDEDSDIVQDITTAIFLLRQRDWQSSTDILSRAADKLGLQEAAIREEMRIDT